MTAEQFNRLPKFAQVRIEELERSLIMLERALETQQQTQPSRVRWGWGDRGAAYGFLKDGETIHFTIHDKPHRCLRVRLTENGLNVNGDGRISIWCGASNDCTVRLEP